MGEAGARAKRSQIPFHARVSSLAPLLSLLIPVFAFAGDIAPAAAPLPSVLLIYADDWDFDELGAYDLRSFPSHTAAHLAGFFPKGVGPKPRMLIFEDPRMRTPNIDSLARDGAMLTRFYVTSPVCTPSRYSALTGRYAGRSPSVVEGERLSIEWTPDLSPEETNLPRRMQALGYRTGLIGKWHNTRKMAVKKGDPESYDAGRRRLQEFGFDVVDRIHFGNRGPKNLEWLVEGALEFLESSKGSPFFLYFALPLPHGQFSETWSKHAITDTVVGELAKPPTVQPPRASVMERLAAEGIPERNSGATWVDDGIGALLAKLDALGVAKDTIVIFTSDHQSRGKYAAYEGARVPCLIRWPARIAPGTRVDALAANIDLLPTLLDAAGAAIPADVDGVSLLPVLGGDPPETWRQALLLEINNSRAVVTPRWKYIANRPPPEHLAEMQADAAKAAQAKRQRLIGWGGKATYHASQSFRHYFDADQLYDLDKDVFEQDNRAGPEAAVLKEMQRRLSDLLTPLAYRFGEFGAPKPAPGGGG